MSSQRPSSQSGEASSKLSSATRQHFPFSRATLDPDALASSDDEQDLQSNYVASIGRNRRIVRSSFHSGQRKPVVHAPGPYASGEALPPPSSSPPALEASEGGSWSLVGATMARGHPSNMSHPWGNAIWNSEAQISPVSRLSEALPSPTGLPSAGISTDPQVTPPVRRDSSSDGAIPFAIPLHPTLKTYRSQSYSVGQLDKDVNKPQASQGMHHPQGSWARAGLSYGSLQHRSSRPNILSDFSPDTSVLEQLREVDDDDDEISVANSESGFRLLHSNSRTIDKLAMEKAALRQQTLTRRQSYGGSRGPLALQQDESFSQADAPFTSSTVVEGSDESLSNVFPQTQAHETRQYVLFPFKSFRVVLSEYL